ncbi:alpha/beta hydrolase [Pseudomonas dryadis]|uniref:Alpha/beta hydrolase n=1 Tax=Phytopseudomonas dryadis TaxID=2487520 RepID=A0A4Q9R6H2_9GAMM|nr:alpha/beta hydrolase [Pseudomonas dryadis]TBV02827.1 alpha/beta hydrolase [Pseudomonas dryadis]TBV15927.1 alpha/beta hydrolase [Pseudomonas sp. FRB 230]
MGRLKTVSLAGGTLLAACLVAACTGSAPSWRSGEAVPASLDFDADRYQSRTLVVDGQSIGVRAYENIVYVSRPLDSTYQTMNIYVPEAYFHDERIGSFTAQTAPIFFPNQVGGYMPGQPGTPEGRRGPPPAGAGRMAPVRPEGMSGPDTGAARTSTIAEALARGYVVASPGARGRTSQDADGKYTGKAPAAIVDLKAAVRYLRYNDARMPGDAEKIVANGTSAGGALSALLGASGNSADYEPYLQALGAAPARDDIFAVSAYCPITNLEHADSAYEWLFGGVNDYQRFDLSMLDYNVQRKAVAGTLTATQIALSDALSQQFPGYLDSLGLRGPQGQALTLDAAGNGSFKDYLESLLIASAQVALDAGQDLSKLDWLTVKNGRVTDLDVDRYVRHAGRQKLPPAFDALDLSSGENQLFGSETLDKRHFTAFSLENGTTAGATLADAATVKMMNPLGYIGAAGASSSAHWRIRHGTQDRDTSLAIPVILATALRNEGYAVDLALPWDRPHSGDYDLDELFAWIERISTQR